MWGIGVWIRVETQNFFISIISIPSSQSAKGKPQHSIHEPKMTSVWIDVIGVFWLAKKRELCWKVWIESSLIRFCLFMFKIKIWKVCVYVHMCVCVCACDVHTMWRIEVIHFHVCTILTLLCVCVGFYFTMRISSSCMSQDTTWKRYMNEEYKNAFQ